MKTTIVGREIPTEPDRRPGTRLSRRQVLQTAVAGGFAASLSIAGPTAGARDGEVQSTDPLSEILRRYGSEFGDLKRIG